MDTGRGVTRREFLRSSLITAAGLATGVSGATISSPPALRESLRLVFATDTHLMQNNGLRSAEGLAAAIRYFDRARALGTTDPADFEQLAKALIATHQETRAVEVLKQGVDLIPYDPVLYQLLGKTYISLKDPAKACEVAGKASQLCSQDDSLRSFMKQCGAGK